MKLLLISSVSPCFAQRVASTFDDLPLNGDLPPGFTRLKIARDTIAVLRARQVPPTYGFVNAKKLEGNADAADELSHYKLQVL
jgi:peptidoglycan-N-acetylglucosamine deacetylase